MNIYTWTGIILIGVTWFFIQKGAKFSAEQNKNQLESKMDSVEVKAIEKIESTTDSTINRINESANQIIGNLKSKADDLEKTMNNLEKQTRRSTKNINENIESSKTQTISKIVTESSDTRVQVIKDGEQTRSNIDLNTNRLKSTIEEGTTADLLKKEFIENLFPILVDYKTSWNNALTNLLFISSIRDYQFSDKDKSVDNLNATMAAVRRLRAEIIKIKSFKDYIVEKLGLANYSRIEVYLEELEKPYVTAMNRPRKGDKTGKKALYEIHREHFNELEILFNKYDSIANLILSIR